MATALRHPHPPLSVRSLLGGEDDAPAPHARAGTDAPLPYVIATLVAWLRTQPHPRGRVGLADGAVLYTPPNGRPTLAVLAAHPDDTHARTADAVDEHLSAGVPVVWVTDGRRRTVTVFHENDAPVLATRTQTAPEHPGMPGFAPPVRDLFE